MKQLMMRNKFLVAGFFAVMFVSGTLGFMAGGFYFSHASTGGGGAQQENQSGMMSWLGKAKDVLIASLDQIVGGEKNEAPDLVVPLSDTPSEVDGKKSTEEGEIATGTVFENAPEKTSNQEKIKKEAGSETKKEISEKQAESKTECAVKANGGQPTREVVINEIAWMGGNATGGQSAATASNNEWFELKNTGSAPRSLVGWQLLSIDGKFHVEFSESVMFSNEGYALFERGDDDTVPGIAADQIYSGTLPNSGTHLQLLNKKCELIDEVDASAGWMAGDNETKKTMEAVEGEGAIRAWQTSAVIGGTPRAKNSGVSGSAGESANNVQQQTQSMSIQQTKNTNQVTVSGGAVGGGGVVSTAAPVYPKLLIFQVQTASTSSTHDEFVEIYNPTGSDVNLTGWYIQKKTKSGKNFSTFLPSDDLDGKNIIASGRFLVAYPGSLFPSDVESDYGLANDNTIVLKNPNGEMVDKVGWGAAADCEGACASQISVGKSIRRKAGGAGFIDSENNAADFEVRPCPDPKGVAAQSCLESLIITFAPSGDNQNTTSSQASSTPIEASTSTATSTTPSSTIPDATSSSSATSTPVENGSSTATSTPPITPGSTSTSTPSSTITMDAAMGLVIFEVQTIGSSGSTTEDYIKIFNASTSTIDISGWKLRKRTATGSESSVRVIVSGTSIAPQEYFTWANSTGGFDQRINANVSSTVTLASDNSVALLNAQDQVIDALAWGTGHINPFVEGSIFGTNTTAGQVIRRRTLSGGATLQDTGNNANDFELCTN